VLFRSRHLSAGLDLPAVLDFADAEIGLSAEVRDALRAPPGRLASGQVFRVISQAQELSSSAGVPLAEAWEWESAAALLREHEGLRRKIAVALAGPRATMRVLTLLPLAGPVVGVVFGIDPWRLYSGSPITVACLGLGLGVTHHDADRLDRPLPALTPDLNDDRQRTENLRVHRGQRHPGKRT